MLVCIIPGLSCLPHVGSMTLPGGPTAGREALMEISGPTLKLMVAMGRRVGTLATATDIPGQCISSALQSQ